MGMMETQLTFANKTHLINSVPGYFSDWSAPVLGRSNVRTALSLRRFHDSSTANLAAPEDGSISRARCRSLLRVGRVTPFSHSLEVGRVTPFSDSLEVGRVTPCAPRRLQHLGNTPSTVPPSATRSQHGSAAFMPLQLTN